MNDIWLNEPGAFQWNFLLASLLQSYARTSEKEKRQQILAKMNRVRPSLPN